MCCPSCPLTIKATLSLDLNLDKRSCDGNDFDNIDGNGGNDDDDNDDDGNDGDDDDSVHDDTDYDNNKIVDNNMLMILKHHMII